jgi:hypothetical protein
MTNNRVEEKTIDAVLCGEYNTFYGLISDSKNSDLFSTSNIPTIIAQSQSKSYIFDWVQCDLPLYEESFNLFDFGHAKRH